MRQQGVSKTGGPIETLQPTPTRAAGPDDDIAALVAEAPPSTAAQVTRITAVIAPPLETRASTAVDSD